MSERSAKCAGNWQNRENITNVNSIIIAGIGQVDIIRDEERRLFIVEAKDHYAKTSFSSDTCVKEAVEDMLRQFGLDTPPQIGWLRKAEL